jgi:hypothetical protein
MAHGSFNSSFIHKVNKHWSCNFVYYMSTRVLLRNTGYWAQQAEKYLHPATLNLCTRSNTKFLSKCQKMTATAWFPHSACYLASFTWPLKRTAQKLKNKQLWTVFNSTHICLKTKKNQHLIVKISCLTAFLNNRTYASTVYI